VKARGTTSLHLSHCASRDNLAILADRVQGNQALSAESALIINKATMTPILDAWYDALLSGFWQSLAMCAVVGRTRGAHGLSDLGLPCS